MLSKIPLDIKQCELCGKNAKLVDSIIEGSLLSVCQNCAKLGKIVVIQKQSNEIIQKPRKIKIVEETTFILKDYSTIIKQARERSNLKQKELAEKLGEKESLIHQLESSHLEPSIALAKKLENILKIKLIEEYEGPPKQINFSDSTLTIGDLIKLKKNELKKRT